MKNLGRLDEALDKYTECAEIFRKEFGTSDPMYTDCVAMLDKVKKELSGNQKATSQKERNRSPYQSPFSNMEEGVGEVLVSLVEVKSRKPYQNPKLARKFMLNPTP
jgi:hypothetical protein